jgi:DNA-binding transcriptional LysR family regulator
MHAVNLLALDLNLLLVLEALLFTRSTTLAAARVGLSQPAASHALSRLRSHFGDPLLVRAGRGLVPTPFATALAPRVTHAVQAVRDTFEAPPSFDARRTDRVFRLHVDDYTTSVLVPHLAEHFARNAPEAGLFMKPGRSPDQELLATGEIDLTFAPHGRLGAPFSSEELFKERFVCVMRRGHPQARRKLTLDTFCKLKHVLIAPAGGSMRGVVDDALERVGRKRHIAVAVPHFLSAPFVVRNTDYVLTLAERVAKMVSPELDLVIASPPVELKGFTLAMYWHLRDEADPGHQFLREMIRKSARSLRR